MAVKEIKKDIFFVGAIHWDRRLFDELIPLPDGTSYNAYIIKGNEKIALIDTVDPATEAQLLTNLKILGINRIDYVISNHAEQDHSGSIPAVLKLFPEAKVVTNEKCQRFLQDLLHIPETRFITVDDGNTLSLGNKTLKFVFTPWVHWPETMVTYLVEDKILFSCDFFGSHLATSQLFVKDDPKVLEDAKRYYAEIMMPFRTIIQKNIEKVKALDLEMIAPSHGPIYLNPDFIIDAYSEWVSDNVKNEVILPYVSMHGSTESMVDYLIDALMNKGITVKPFNLTVTDIGELVMALVDAATIILATPTVLTGAHPAAVYAAFLTNALRPKLKFAGIIGSYGWGGKTVEQIKGLLSNLKVELLEPVLIKGLPKIEDLKLLDNLAETIYKKHKEAGII
ncbi:MAG: FprA family A-type flavoprotein [Candidatus Hydrothermae bacterium]|nr:FprA family A-type flavoprotein [Candidatus Hydrothermae bacterium]